jgi:hypothetical protein
MAVRRKRLLDRMENKGGGAEDNAGIAAQAQIKAQKASADRLVLSILWLFCVKYVKYPSSLYHLLYL